MLSSAVNNETIAAIATAAGTAAIGIIRISGTDSIKIVSEIFRFKGKIATHRMYYGKIVFGGKVIDEVMVAVFLAPKTFTAEDTVEIYTHGGIFVTSAVLDAVIKSGARHATPGEFTKRAYLNGRINLTQAEAVMDIIGAKSELARRVGLRQLGGSLSSRITDLRGKILSWIAHIELSIDYPEHEEEAKNAQQILTEAPMVVQELGELLKTASIGRIIKNGLKTAILGKPNVGKSTILNYILSEDRAIVHALPGTTRDVLTEEVRIGNLALVLMDTAGIRKTSDEIEKIGMDKSFEAGQEADIVLYVIDATVGISYEDIELIRIFGDKVVLLYNKVDLAPGGIRGFQVSDAIQAMDDKDLRSMQVANAIYNNLIRVSAKTGAGFAELFAKLESMHLPQAMSNDENEIITRERHRLLIESAMMSLQTALIELENGTTEDLVSINLREAYRKLGEILGEETGDDIAERIFAEFCVGK